MGLDPLAPSTSGGRWVPPNEKSVIYTSKEREGALAEVAFHWSQLTPFPSKPVALHRIRLTAEKTLRLILTDLEALGIDQTTYWTVNYQRTQEIGAAVAFLECDGLIVPSARWQCENFVLFLDNHSVNNELEVIRTEITDLRIWARDHQFLGEQI